MNKFSIIVPIYNSEKYIEKCICSITKQSYKNIEIILVNDGSTDNSYEKCKHIAKKDDRIKLINKINEGVSSARNTGIEEAIGEYILFLDSDDWLEIDAIECCNKYIREIKYDMVIFEILKVKKIEENKLNYKIKNNSYTVKSLFEELLYNPKHIERINSVCAKLYKLNIIKKNNIKFNQNIQMGEDLLFNIEYLEFTSKVLWSNKIIYNYYIDNNISATKKYISNKYEQLIKVNNRLKLLLKNIQDKKLLKIQKYIRIKNIYSCFKDLYHKDCNYTYRQKISFIKKVRKENGIIMVNKMGIVFQILSFCYSYLFANIILLLVKMIIILELKFKKQ